MSLLVDLLKKLKGKEVNRDSQGHLPPNLKMKERKSFFTGYKNITILTALLIGVGVLAIFGFEFFKNYMSNQNTVVNINPEKFEVSKPKEIKKDDEKIAKFSKKSEEIKKNNEKVSEVSKKTEELKKNNEKVAVISENLVKPLKKSDESKNSEIVYKLPPPKIDIQEKAENKIDNSQIWKHINLAESYIKNGETLEAIKEYQYVLKYYKNEKVIFNLASLLIKVNKKDQLVKIIEDYKVYKDPDTILKITGVLLKYNDYQFAKKFIEKYGKKTEKYIYLCLLGLYSEKIGNLNEALKFYEEAYKLNPKNELIGYSYARLQDIKGNYNNALKIYKKLLNITYDENLKRILKDRINILEGVLQ